MQASCNFWEMELVVDLVADDPLEIRILDLPKFLPLVLAEGEDEVHGGVSILVFRLQIRCDSSDSRVCAPGIETSAWDASKRGVITNPEKQMNNVLNPTTYSIWRILSNVFNVNSRVHACDRVLPPSSFCIVFLL